MVFISCKNALACAEALLSGAKVVFIITGEYSPGIGSKLPFCANWFVEKFLIKNDDVYSSTVMR